MNNHNKPTVFKRPDSQWWWFSLYTEEGRKRKSCKKLGLSIDDYTQEQASEILNNYFDSISENIELGKGSLAWLRDIFLKTIERESVRHETILSYSVAVNHLINMLGESFLLSDIKKIPHVKQFQYSLLKKNQRPASVNNKCRSLRAVFERLYDNEMIERNPFHRFKPVRESKKDAEDGYFTPEELKLIFDSMKQARNQDGRRPSEILNLQHNDVDLKSKPPRIKPMNIKHRERPKKWIDVPKIVIKDIKYFMGKNNRSEYPFKICSCSTLGSYFRRWKRRAGISEEKSLKELRHTFVTLGLNSGVSAWQIKDYLDHSSIRLIEKYYSHTKSTGTVDLGIDLVEQK